ncbi:MAG: alpha/beta hydrolase [Hamadaea sp.]|uniref:alpha/beta fold hydrolase n=1 Tax=Hamadaea sp. TaxID=2024425 RepID=UPI0017ABD507|nr:alpha/beta hydrolase [Hamadaea sp.]NUR69210.1 alpha/beta hydrolase [Hamadaea sp.]NUT20050.1 alpha/beta hydrolase [Hamadaea sp.]
MSWYGPDGQQIYYEDAGQGDTVLLMPGWGSSVVDLNRLRDDLAYGFRVIAVDLPGSGRSQPQPRHYPPTYYLDDAHLLLGLLDELQVDVAHFVGFSDGGEEALLMAALQPARALSVLTWGAAGHIESSPEALHGLANLLTDPPDGLKPLAAYLAEQYGVDQARIMARSWAEAMSAVIDAGGDVSRSRAADITCPALLIAGTYDPFCPPALVRAMADDLPRGAYREAGGGHDIHLSHGRWLAATITDWLSEH